MTEEQHAQHSVSSGLHVPQQPAVALLQVGVRHTAW
jgi:hypothetical protein